jgi:imidazolonepropionase-like amidohydrolase
MRWPRPKQYPHVEELGDGLVLRGPLWNGPGDEHPDAAIVIDAMGNIAAVGAAGEVGTRDLPVVEAGWIGPGLVDHHVHLSFGNPDHVLAHGVVEVRDLGAPPTDALTFRGLDAPRVRVSGPLLTAPGGYPSRTWGRAGFAAFVDDPEQADRLVTGLASQVDVIKLALEADGGPVPAPDVVAAVVAAAHREGLEVTCHALTVAMVERALDAAVDELAHTPTELLPAELVGRLAESGTRVVSTLHTFAAGGDGSAAISNAAALAAAGVGLRYGTDLGNAAVQPGADPVELRMLAVDVGLGVDGALAAATAPIEVGRPAAVVALATDPRAGLDSWRDPLAVVVATTVLRRRTDQ